MKVIASLLFILCCFSSSFGQYDIQGKIKGLQDSDVYLAHYFGYNQQVIKDTVRANSAGEFRFKGAETLPKGLYLVSFSKTKYVDILVEEPSFSFSLDTVDIIHSIAFVNSPENSAFYAFQKEMSDRFQQINQPGLSFVDKQQKSLLIQKYQQEWMKINKELFVTKLVGASFDPEIPAYPGVLKSKSDSTKLQLFQYNYYKSHYFDGIDLSDERMVRTPFLQRKLERFFKDLVVQQPDSINKEADRLLTLAKNTEIRRYVIYKIASTYENNPILGTEGSFVHLAEKYYIGEPTLWDTTTVRRMKERVAIIKPLLLGQPFPSMYVTDVNEKEIQIASLPFRHTVVFIYDPDCSHCKQEAPKLAALSTYFKSKNIGVLATSIVRDKAAWKKFIIDFKVQNWVNGIDIHKNIKTGKEEYYTDFQRSFDVYSTPVLYILDQNKKIVGKRIPVENLKDFFTYLETNRK